MGKSIHAHTQGMRAHTQGMCAYPNCMRMHTRVCIRMQASCARIHTRNPKPRKPKQKIKKTQQKQGN